MRTEVYKPGNFIEELVFKMEPEDVQQYAELEYEIMARELAELPTFRGWQIFASESEPGEVTTMYFWESYEAYKAIDQEWLAAKKQALSEAFKGKTFVFLRAEHEINRKLQLRSIIWDGDNLSS